MKLERPDRVELAVGIAAVLALLCVVALLWAGAPVRSPEAKAMQCMADNGWADLACERFAGLPTGWVWPR